MSMADVAALNLLLLYLPPPRRKKRACAEKEVQCSDLRDLGYYYGQKDPMESDNGKATLLNCLKRSLMFKTVALLSGMNSGMLFLKGVAAEYVVFILIIMLSSLFKDGFDITEMLAFALAGTLMHIVISGPLTLFVAFIINLFLKDDVMKIANIITFSRIYNIALDGFRIVFSDHMITSMLVVLSFVIFIGLLVRNIRALTKK